MLLIANINIISSHIVILKIPPFSLIICNQSGEVKKGVCMILDFSTYLVEISTDTDATQTDVPTLPEATDDRLYMSQAFQGKTIDDVYSMLVSCRNCLLLLCFIVFIFEAHKLLKNAMKRHFKA